MYPGNEDSTDYKHTDTTNVVIVFRKMYSYKVMHTMIGNICILQTLQYVSQIKEFCMEPQEEVKQRFPVKLTQIQCQ